MVGFFDLGCGCLCEGTPPARYGFDLAAWKITTDFDCFPGIPFVENIASNISLLNDDLKLVFAGTSGPGTEFCPLNSIFFDEEDWARIRTWIEAGGRFFLSTEFQGCLLDEVAVDNFLLALGSTMIWSGGSFDSGCSRVMTTGPAAIVEDIGDTRMAATAQVFEVDGTVVFTTQSGGAMVAVEQLGKGFLFLSGDGDIFRGLCPDFTNCEFARRLLENSDSDII